jgi:hypothetical protein
MADERTDGDAPTVDWAGRTFGQLTAAEKTAVLKGAAAKLEAELTNPAMVAAITGDPAWVMGMTQSGKTTT